jgi:acetyl esterase/lipase
VAHLIIKKRYVEENESGAYFTAYLLEDSKELLPGKKRPVVVIAPGGGYLFTSDREAEPIAMKFLSLGYHAVVLRYTTGDREGEKAGVGKLALRELAHTVRYLRQKSDLWYLDQDKITVCGFSAGAHLAASLGVHWHDKELADSVHVEQVEVEEIRPNALILGYGLLDYQVMKDKAISEADNEEMKDTFAFTEIANRALTGVTNLTDEVIKEFSPSCWVSENTPPSFLWHTSKDNLVFSENSLTFALALAKHKVPYELHVFQEGGHGLALANEVTANSQEQLNQECEIWFDLAAKWLRKNLPL